MSRLVRTPLWTDYPEKMEQFGYTNDNSITAESVAKTMIELVTEGKYGGGTTLECAASGSRSLGTWNIEPPDVKGTSVPAEVIKRNLAPIKEKLAKERSLL